MSNQWTQEQQQVIDTRGKNLLVSAAAGSGKTAVLVERIIKKITDINHPVDIDQLLVVTFTNAAAAQMRERIQLAIEKALKEKPKSIHLQKQSTLLHSALITTIHSFCLHVIRNYFHKIDLDPTMRIGEEGELKLLKGEVFDEVLLSYYEEGTQEFLDFIETFATGKHDLYVKDNILQLYEFAMSDPWPREWLLNCRKPYQLKTLEEFEASHHGKALLIYLKILANAWGNELKEGLEISENSDGPTMYVELLTEEVEMMEGFSICESIQDFYDKIMSINFKRLPAARKFTGDAMKKATVQELRNGVKDSIKKTKQQFFYQPPKEFIADLQNNGGIVTMLTTLTISFMDAFCEAKQDKNLMDYHDMEHFTLKILLEQESKEPTQTALEIRERFDEIMVDEYQDSNYVQEAIIKSIAKEQNVFMVGDVKQSIYRFRMARPELFMEKYDTYEADGKQGQRIDLHKNFRSRCEVIESVNDVFYKIMNKDMGNIQYNDNTALYSGGSFLKHWDTQMFQTEIMAVDLDTFKDMGEEGLQDPKEIEVNVIAAKIKKMLKEQFVTDEDTGELRLARYSDIVILLRSLQGSADLLIEVLKENHIPAQAQSGTGYFSSIEVQTVLNLLKIIDNPRQDIPMTAVLSSPIVNITGEELASIRIEFPDMLFHQAVFAYEKEGKQENLRKKIQDFILKLTTFRSWVSYKPIHQLLYDVMEETGYAAYAKAMPAGEIRQGNLNMLLKKAMVYEQTSYRGLFHFIRYMDQLQKYDVDFPEANTQDDTDAVTIMSIHKSKGLEFPIVILAFMGRQFNQQDLRGKMLLHPELYIGIDSLNPKRRLKSPCILKQMQAALTKLENWGEELRVLYVAMTRAKEKLVLIGTLKKADEKLTALQYITTREDESLSFLKRISASNYFDWILKALAGVKDKYEFQRVDPAYIMESFVTQKISDAYTYQQLTNELRKFDEELYQSIEERFTYQYPFEDEKDMKMKFSVSEIKNRNTQKIKEEDVTYTFEEDQITHYVPAFMREEKQAEGVNGGTLRGSAMHRVLECYDFANDTDTLAQQIDRMYQEKKIDDQVKQLISVQELTQFLRSSLAKRMQYAAKSSKLYKEKPFMMGKPAKDVLNNTDSEELILIQGIVDVFFEENGVLVLLDYKTDRIHQRQEFVRKYKSQMDLYGEALLKATGMQVKEKIIYSFTMKKEIVL